ncbi:hypothetical protein [Kitasatospora sp. NPDC086791]|uniref:hypothetical protein n=1 Tax=Kitasatospora sp. NPDC086791 TaxID=3155178 RepID=UPI00343FB566
MLALNQAGRSIEVVAGIWWSPSERSARCTLCGHAAGELADAPSAAGWGDGHQDICIPVSRRLSAEERD